MKILTLNKPDDMHLHLRDGSLMRNVLIHSARQFARAVIMPNLEIPVCSVEQALAYRQRIIHALPTHMQQNSAFDPLMTLYLTVSMSIDEIRKASQSDHIYAVKYYPEGATTHSNHGVADLNIVYPLLEVMADNNLPLLVHGEVVDPRVDIFDREAVFIERFLAPLMHAIPELRIVLEHITTKEAVDFVWQSSANLAATITPQHLLLNRNALFLHGLRPHHYCLPVLKAERHRQAIVNAATSGNPKFFLGTDSAPHVKEHKESAHGCAGIYAAFNAIELYAEVFEQAGCLDKLQGFASQHGADFYGLPRNQSTIVLRENAWQVPATLPVDDLQIVPLRAGEQCKWELQQ